MVHILVLVDYFSRYKEVEIMTRITAKDTVGKLAKNIYATRGKGQMGLEKKNKMGGRTKE